MSLALDDLSSVLREVRSKPLFVMRLQVKPLQRVGATPSGYRRVGVISGGEFRGERLQGTVIEGGSDWQYVRSDAATTLNVRLVLKTDEGALIGMNYSGIRHGPPEVIQRIEAGETVNPETHYFRMSATFETEAKTYDWLNRVLALGIGHRQNGGPVYSLFEIL